MQRRYGITCNSLFGLSLGADEVLHLAIGYHSIVVADHVLIPKAFDASAYPAGINDTSIASSCSSVTEGFEQMKWFADAFF